MTFKAHLLARLKKVSLLEWAMLIVGAVLVHRYVWIMDDAFIYFRYVDNLLFRDVGLVWNPGEYVEGFTSPLWALILIAWRSSGLDYLQFVLVSSVAAWVALWALLVHLNTVMSRGPTRALNLPLLGIGLCYGSLSFMSSGLETPLVQLAAACMALYLAKPGPRLETAVSVSPLVRPEFALPVGVILLYRWWTEGRFPRSLVVRLLALNLPWLLFRVWYYADLLPNTFYMKDTTWWSQGVVYLLDALVPYGALVLVPIGIGMWAAVAEKDRQQWLVRAAMVVCAVSVMLYVVRIGGDARHFRYLVFTWCLLFCALAGLPALWASSESAAVRWAGLAYAGLVAVLVVSGVPAQSARHPLVDADRSCEQLNLIVDGACRYRTTPKLRAYETWRDSMTPAGVRDSERGCGETQATRSCAHFYREICARALQPAGFTSRFLAHLAVPPKRPGHRPGARKYTNDLVRLFEAGIQPGRGMFRAAIERGIASRWMERNLDVLEVLERKTFNTQSFAENVGLALQFPPKMQPHPKDMDPL